MQDEEKSNGGTEVESIPVPPLGEILEVEVENGEAGVDSVNSLANPAFLFVFLSLLAFALALCLPSIMGDTPEAAVRVSEPSHPVLDENRAAQQDLQRTLEEIESALQNPQGE